MVQQEQLGICSNGRALLGTAREGPALETRTAAVFRNWL